MIKKYTVRQLEMAYLPIKLQADEKVKDRYKCTFCWKKLNSCKKECSATGNSHQDRKKDYFLHG